ncbi:MAG: 1-deoxy-D-xylulose-5-phosphate synthase [Clostridia bacterium]|nr:1-deoxy-D-xylulose-5-phosphate synthase [Clostridia bacterium]
MSYPILDTIHSPADLKALSAEQVSALADEIRAYLIHEVTAHGGHLASNLGVIELTLALHRVFTTPHDHIIFDVGHQCYVHKLLTGRRDRFPTLRQGGGLSGFTLRTESEHDCFGAGHSSTSLSAALGFAQADRLRGSDAYSIAVIGDGAFTGGMIHEALNNCEKNLRLIIILNENEMSISKNTGRFAKNLARLRTSGGYIRTKRATRNIISHIPLIGPALFRGIRDIKQTIKNMVYSSNYFEDLGLYYLGPVDGHDSEALEILLREAIAAGQSAIIHVKTQKGHGYAPAEQSPSAFHAIPPAGKQAAHNFSAEFGHTLTKLAAEDARICAITAAMSEGTGLEEFRRAHTNRFFDVGIAEEHAVTFAAGLAAHGMRPFCAIYSTFLQRGYDSIIHDVALQKLPVIFGVDRAGLNAGDGATHHGIFDVAFLAQIPNMTIYTPATFGALRSAMHAALAADGPVAIRYPNAGESPAIRAAFYPEGDSEASPALRCDYADGEELDAVIICHGRIAAEALAAESALSAQGLRCGVMLLELIKPFNRVADLIEAKLPRGEAVVLFLEEEIRAGGMGMLLTDQLSQRSIMQNKQIRILAVDDHFVQRDRDISIFAAAGVDRDAIIQEILAAAEEKKA